MSDDEAPAAPPRPWWAPLLGVGSLGFGALQAFTGIAFVAGGLSVPPDARPTFLLLGAAWLIPGLLLVIGGVGVTLGAGWGRKASLAAVAALAIGVGAVAAQRASVPAALADAVEWSLPQPWMPKWIPQAVKDFERERGISLVANMRDPSTRQDFDGWLYPGYCCVPALPWYALVLVACAGPWGRRLTKQSE